MAYRRPKTALIFFFLVCVHWVHSVIFFFLYCLFFLMHCLTLIHRYMVQKENIKLTNVKLHCLNCKLFVEDETGVAIGAPSALTFG